MCPNQLFIWSIALSSGSDLVVRKSCYYLRCVEANRKYSCLRLCFTSVLETVRFPAKKARLGHLETVWFPMLQSAFPMFLMEVSGR